MGWRTVIINEHSKLSYKNNHLVYKSVNQYELIHLSEIDILLLETTDIVVTTMLFKRLIDANILIIFCDDKRLPMAKVMPFYGRHDSSLQLSRQLKWQEEKKSEVWTTIISQKMSNQQSFLKNLDFIEKSQAIEQLIEGLLLFDPSNREGHAARIYFNTLYGNKFTREQDSDINAALNYGYTLLMSLFAREIVKNGCMTQFGLKHSNQFNDFNLASDIMEPFRCLIDEIVYEHRDKKFKTIKRALFQLFDTQYTYNHKQMFLTNIVEDYTKKIVKALNNEIERIPEFRI